MTRTTNARIAGITFLLYIVMGITHMALFGQAASGADTAAKLASIARNATMVRFTVLLTMLTFANAVLLAVALYALTRDEDRDLSVLALAFRVSEAVMAAVGAVRTLGLLSLASASATATGPDAAAANALGAMLLQQGAWTGLIAAICFAAGSLLYCYLFLRARTIPVSLAWLGLLASVLLVVALPLQLTGFARANWFIWMPMLVFELAFALWLIIKGVAPQRVRSAA